MIIFSEFVAGARFEDPKAGNESNSNCNSSRQSKKWPRHDEGAAALRASRVEKFEKPRAAADRGNDKEQEEAAAAVVEEEQLRRNRLGCKRLRCSQPSAAAGAAQVQRLCQPRTRHPVSSFTSGFTIGLLLYQSLSLVCCFISSCIRDEHRPASPQDHDAGQGLPSLHAKAHDAGPWLHATPASRAAPCQQTGTGRVGEGSARTKASLLPSRHICEELGRLDPHTRFAGDRLPCTQRRKRRRRAAGVRRPCALG